MITRKLAAAISCLMVGTVLLAASPAGATEDREFSLSPSCSSWPTLDVSGQLTIRNRSAELNGDGGSTQHLQYWANNSIRFNDALDPGEDTGPLPYNPGAYFMWAGQWYRASLVLSKCQTPGTSTSTTAEQTTTTSCSTCTTTAPPETTTTVEQTTTTIEVSPTTVEATTTIPETTTTPDPTTTTDAPATTAAPCTTCPTTTAATVGLGVAGTSVSRQVELAAGTVATRDGLPRTGSSTGPLTALGALLVLGGAALLVPLRRRSA